jgi:hypothetical protein
MCSKPGGKGFGLPAGQHVDRPMRVYVQQHGAVDVSTTQREIIDPERRDRAQLRQRRRAQQVKQGVPADRHAQVPSQPGAGPTGQGDRNGGQRALDGGLYRECGLVRPGNCSANVTLAQPASRHARRRTSSRITTGRPATAVSASQPW